MRAGSLRFRFRPGSIGLGGALWWCAFAGPGRAQVAPDTVVVVPGARYQAGAVRRFVLGANHRELWATPLKVAVLDVTRFAGGLVAVERGGSRQSRALRFRSGDGRNFVFRALEKDPTQTWPETLRRSPARKFAEDQISAIFPAGALAVARLESAVGLINPGISLVALPDDPRLGPWRGEFAANIGILEQRLRGAGESIRAIPGAAEVVTSSVLFQRLKTDPGSHVDAPRFLAARLFDLFVGDWDRHADQWSWARFDRPNAECRAPSAECRVWLPVPRDRDWALSRLDGPFYALLRFYMPKYQTFGARIGSVYGLTLSAEPLDRRLLSGLEWPVWDSVVTDLVTRLSDEVIDQAVAALPPEFDRGAVARLRTSLISRRGGLSRAAARFYRQLAGVVEFRSAGATRLGIVPGSDGSVVVTMSDSSGTTRLSRGFRAGETDEVRVFLPGAAVAPVAGPIRVRVVTDSAAQADPIVMPRDWGHLMGVVPWFEARPEIGTLIGGGPVLTTYGYGRFPYASRFALRAGYPTGAPGLNLDLKGDVRFRSPRRRLTLEAGYLTVDVVRYFGFGNQTVRSGTEDFYNVRQQLSQVETAVEFGLGRHGKFEVGGFLRSSSTDLDRPTLLAEERPYGSGSFAIGGLRAGIGVDTRDHPRYPTRGFTVHLGGRVVPRLLDATEAFGGVDLTGSAFLTASGMPARPTLALRAGASRTAGRTPFFEAPSIGGRSSVRGLNSRRFLGDGAAYGTAEVRLDLGRFTVLLPGEWGVYGLADAGRVSRRGEQSDRWHQALGGGLWFAFLDRSSTVTITYAAAEDRSKVYFQAGFHF